MLKKPVLDKHLDISKNLIRFMANVSREDRNALNRHASGLMWFTGFSGAGKSTLAHELEKELFSRKVRAYVLDGDNVRHGLNADLGFSRADRKENIRRIGEIARLFMDAGLIVLASFIAPYKEDRALIRQKFLSDRFYEVYVKCSLPECEKRDPKGMYRKARQGIIKSYTGISSPYEEPESPDLIIDTERLNVEQSVRHTLAFMAQVGLLSDGEAGD